MISMNKVFKTLQRYVDTLLRAHAKTALMTLDRDPGTMSAIPTRREAELNPDRSSTA